MNSLNNVIKFDKNKGIVGLVLALSIFVISCIWFDWHWGISFAIVFLAIGFVRLNFDNKFVNVFINLLWGFAFLVITWYVSYTSTNTLGDISKSYDKILLNILCIAVVCGVLMALSANWKITICVSSVLLCVLATASGFINQFRGKELCPVDFLSWSTALNVADQYTPKVSLDMFLGWLLCLVMVFVAFTLPRMPKFHVIWSRVSAIALTILLTFAMLHGAKDVKIQSWGDFGSRFNGFYLNFALGIRDLSFNKPENYSVETVKQYEQDYTPLPEEEPTVPTMVIVDEPEPPQQDVPNIIVIMDESFGDFRVFGKGLNTNQPVTPFIDSLEENTIKGYALASVFGGNTANSEFEFLTGSSLAFLPPNAIPYQQYIKGELGTLAWMLNEYGYKSTATHPCPSGNWSRGRIYPYFGFDDNTFEDSYPEGNLIREFVSDKAVFEHILQKVEAKEQGVPIFVFAVTMQNHSSYNYSGDNFTQTIELEGYSREYPAAEQYLSLIHETDSAVEYLLTELENSSEDTIVVLFGDHLPAVENEFYDELYGDSFDTLEEQMLQYKVPFFIWANYDIEEKYIECTSINYLSRYLLEAADFELAPFYSFLKDMEDVVPAMNSIGYYSKENEKFITYEEAKGKEAEFLSEYSILQYNNLFDSKNRSEIFFGDNILLDN